MLPIIHHYHPETGVYIGAGLADPSPMEQGVWLVPAHATDIEPPVAPNGQVAVWAGAAWAVLPNIAPPDAAPQSPEHADGVPVSVSMAQARLALLGAGLLAQVDAAIAAMPGIDGEAARIEWEFRPSVRRDSPLVQGLSGVLGLTGEQLDALFVAAAAIA